MLKLLAVLISTHANGFVLITFFKYDNINVDII